MGRDPSELMKCACFETHLLNGKSSGHVIVPGLNTSHRTFITGWNSEFNRPYQFSNELIGTFLFVKMMTFLKFDLIILSQEAKSHEQLANYPAKFTPFRKGVCTNAMAVIYWDYRINYGGVDL